MNDTELDEMLNRWGAPPVPPTLREHVRAGFSGGPKRRPRRRFARTGWSGLFAGVATAAVLFLLVITEAFPQSLGWFSGGFTIPYVVESDFVRYRADGSENVSHVTSFMNGGDQILLKVTNPNDGLFTSMMTEVAIPFSTFMLRVAPSVILPKQSEQSVAWHRALVSNGCVQPGGAAIGHETILGHATTVVSGRGHAAAVAGGGSPERITQWMAPDLGCFTLRLTIEEPQPNGSFRLSIKSRAVKVTMNH